jgi:hypothetical protein
MSFKYEIKDNYDDKLVIQEDAGDLRLSAYDAYDKEQDGEAPYPSETILNREKVKELITALQKFLLETV